MKIRNFRFGAVVLSALTVGMKLAHVLELGPKLQWDADLYFPVQTTLYKVFAVAGPIVDLGAVACLIALVVILRGRPAFGLTLAALSAMFVSLVIWGAVVAPANAQLSSWISSHTIPADWQVFRDRWQFGQTACFVFDFSGFLLLLLSVLRETPKE